MRKPFHQLLPPLYNKVKDVIIEEKVIGLCSGQDNAEIKAAARFIRIY
jgi:hypothetical protein